MYPVILCGGVGERLWPMSRAERPKPFLTLVGDRSGFQNAALRAWPLVDQGELIVVAGVGHRQVLHRQLSEIGVPARILLEPIGRDTAAAVAAAAGWVAQRAPDAILVVLAADHHIPDDGAFQAAIRQTLPSAADGAIVMLGVRPTSASTSYGYVTPARGEAPVRPIIGFEEKPGAERAEKLIAAGGLWNSGTFVAMSSTFWSEIDRHAGAIAKAVDAALDQHIALEGAELLGGAFSDAPAMAFDRAVMEKTDLGAVLRVEFAWSDLGAWDSVLAASTLDADGNSLCDDATSARAKDILVRSPPGVRVAVFGVSRVAVVVEPDAVLVCGLEEAQSVRGLGGSSGGVGSFRSLDAATEALDLWLRTAALPLWGTLGVDAATGRFRDALTWTGDVVDPHHRTRVQARQAFVFASATADDIAGPWAALGDAAFEAFEQSARRPDGLYASIVDASGGQSDPLARLYENAFVMLALSARRRCNPDGPDADRAASLSAHLPVFAHLQGGFREAGPHPFQANASMHLFEAALAWEQAGGGQVWRQLADSLAELAMGRFIDDRSGALMEFFDEHWTPLEGRAGLIEPGHQFEWAWLLARWGRSRNDPRGEAAARRLFSVGRKGFDPGRAVVVDALWDDLSVRDASARLWPQCEHLKAALILGEMDAALQAANTLDHFLATPVRGVWRERMRADGHFVEEPSPATSLYHLYLAIRELSRHRSNSC